MNYLHISECAHMIHYVSLECQTQPACYGLDKTNIFIRRYILYFIRYFVNFWRKLQTTTTCRAEQSSADVETGRPLQDSLRPATLLPSEGYYTLFFGFNLSQTAFFAQTALYFSRFDVIILKLVPVIVKQNCLTGLTWSVFGLSLSSRSQSANLYSDRLSLLPWLMERKSLRWGGMISS